MSEPFAYDDIAYPTRAMPLAHPGRLAAVARMYGVDAAPPDRCRMIEFGCGEATHLIACAAALPDATFVGIDLSAEAIGRGRRLAEAVGLTNLTLHAADLTAWEPDGGPFDYAVAHGLYSWVPPPVRDALLGLYGRHLSPSGVGFVSYNTLPGCHVRRMLGEMLKFHAAGFETAAERIAQGRAMAKFLREGQRAAEEGPVLAKDLDKLLTAKDPAAMYHDDMAEVNDPVYLHQFVGHAGRHGLRFVCEAEPAAMNPAGAKGEPAAVLDQLAASDPVMKEQYLDFLRLRRFRQTLLARDGGTPRSAPDPARVAGLFVTGRLSPDPEKGPADPADGVGVEYRTPPGGTMTLSNDLVKAAAAELDAARPDRLPFDELVRRAAGRLGRTPTPADEATLVQAVTELWTVDAVDLDAHRPAFVRTPSARPVAARLARAQAAAGRDITTPLFGSVRLEDEPLRRLLAALDGTRDRDGLAAAVLEGLPAGTEAPPDLLPMIDVQLDRFASYGLLVG